LSTIFKVATAEALGISLAVVLVDASYIGTAAGDQLLARLQPYFTPRPVLLVAADDDRILSYAPFQTQRIAEALGDQDLDWYDLDISVPPPDDNPLPF
jgi:hypothetical protein